MNKLFKSKFLLGVLVVVAVFAAVGVFTSSPAAAADCTIYTTLRVGSVGADVQCLQSKLGVTADGKFGPMTKAAVVAWQASKGLVADGVVGPVSRAALMGTPVVTLPAGCQAGWAFNPVTGQSCTGGSTPSTGSLSGGAGDVAITSTSSDVENTVKEGDEEVKVLGFQVEAEDSDIKINNVKVLLKNTGYNAGDGSSEKLSRYVEEVSVMMGDEVVGSADASDFSKDSGAPDEFTKSIALDNAVVKEDQKVKFYVAVTTNSSVDSEDMDDADWYVSAETLRFEDAEGVVTTTTVNKNNTFDFEDANTDDSLDIKTSSANPEDETIKVDENDTTDDVLGLAFKLDVDEDSADVSVTSMTITVNVSNFDADKSGTVDGSDDIDVSAAGQWADRIVDSLIVEIDGEEFEAELDDNVGAAQDVADGAGSATYTVDFDDDEMMIDSGDVVDAKVFFNFNDQDGNYNEGVIVTAKLAATTDISAETENDEVTVGGSSKTGADLTLNLSSAVISSYSWSVNSTGSIVDFFFKVQAEDDDFDVLAAKILEDAPVGTATVAAAGDLPATTEDGLLTKYSGDDVTTLGGVGTETGFRVAEGDTTTFRLRYSLTTGAGTNGQWKEFTITSVGGKEVPDDKETSPTATLNVPS